MVGDELSSLTTLLQGGGTSAALIACAYYFSKAAMAFARIEKALDLITERLLRLGKREDD